MADPEIKKVTIADLANKAQAPATEQPAPEVKMDGEGDEPPEQPIRPESLFFNVMPRVKSQNPNDVVQPTLKIEQPHEAASAKSDFLKKYKLYLIIGVGVIILGIAVYFIATKIGSDAYKPAKPVVAPPKTTTSSSSNASSTQLAGQSGADFTTPQAWRDKYWPNCTDPSECGDQADPDHDGLTNLQEYKLGTDPNNPDSDQDGISDGDEVNVFSSNPLNSHTANDPKYSDADYFKGGFDLGTGKKMTAAQIAVIAAKMKQFGLHQPTITTLGSYLTSLYNFPTGSASSTPTSLASSTPPSASSSPMSGLDESLSGKQTRDTRRSDTIENIEGALVKYQADNQAYPVTNDFGTMYAEVKIYLKVATDPVDPINQPPYVYSYISNASGTDFSLTFYSEVAGQPISKNAAEAQKDTATQQALIYDNQRETDLQNIRSALLLYSQANVAGNQDFVFPTVDKYQTALVPNYLEAIPKDPETAKDYPYQVSATFDTFTLKTTLDNPPTGTTGYECNQDSCQNY
jgi:hypothetical protein